jgi:hypothetical protein
MAFPAYLPLRKANSLGLFLLALFLSGLMLSCETAFAADVVSSWRGGDEITVDGMWTAPDEWWNATQLQAYGRTGVFCVQNDEEFLYVLIDFVTDTKLDDRDIARIRLDVKNDKSDRPQTDDLMILVDRLDGALVTRIVRGSGTGWALTQDDLGVRIALSANSRNDRYSKERHLIYEFAIPRQIFGDRTKIGFSATAGSQMGTSDADFMNLPRRHHFMNPSTWVTLVFATETGTSAVIPLGLIAVVAVMVAIVAAIAVYYRKRRRQKRGSN